MIAPVQFRVLSETIPYTGAELRPHWGLERTRVYGSLLTAFIGPCEVATEKLVDMEDRLASDHIRARSMLHVLGEFFGMGLESGVFCQRLLIAHAEALLRKLGWAAIEREGDDLFVDGKKLSVSIATVSSVSVLIHWGFNVDPEGAPVRAVGLKELGWDNERVLDFAKELLSRYSLELEDIRIAQCKVRPVPR